MQCVELGQDEEEMCLWTIGSDHLRGNVEKDRKHKYVNKHINTYMHTLLENTTIVN